MPRVESAKHLSAQFYHSQFTNSHYLSDSSSSPPSSSASQQQAPSSPTSTSSSSTSTPKKKHICPTCDRTFTTSGHLARHSRVHTGERNHKCPFPGCETRCSRQDNLQQHYRIHLSPGSRRSSARGSARGHNTKKALTVNPLPLPVPAEPPTELPPPPLTPPPLEQARITYTHDDSPPDSPPPLAQATLPATATLSLAVARLDAASDRSSSSGSPQGYPSPAQNVVPISPQSSSVSAGQAYSYRSGTTTYQEQSQGTGPAFTYVHTTPLSQQSANTSAAAPYPSYSDSANATNYSSHSLQHHATQNRSSPVSVPVPSRHSISHISHPRTSYSQNQSSSAGPASPASSQSVSSHASGPPTPTYPVFHDESQSYHGTGVMAEHPGLHTTHIISQPHILHNQYPSNVQATGRFESPPPTLAPIQDERFVRRDTRHSSHHPSPYIHQPQPLPTEYSYHHQSLGLAHGAWKGDSGMRKGGLGTALV